MRLVTEDGGIEINQWKCLINAIINLSNNMLGYLSEHTFIYAMWNEETNVLFDVKNQLTEK